MDEETKTEETQEANTEEKEKPLDNMTAIALREVQASEKVSIITAAAHHKNDTFQVLTQR